MTSREQFEAWYSKSWEAAGGEPVNSFVKDDRGQYHDTYVHDMWVVWQASRAALVIDSPAPRPDEWPSARTRDAYNLAIDLSRQAIKAAGVKVKL